MPWRAPDPLTERAQFMGAYLRHLYTMTALGERFGIRRHTGYKWVRRSTTEGLAGLKEKPRTPHRCPHRTAAEVEAALLEAKRAHPHGDRARSSPLWRRAGPTWHSRRQALQASSAGARG
jgi:transposase